MRSDDLAPLLAPPQGDSQNVRWGVGTVVSWNTATAENVIRFRGTDLVNLPIVASNAELLQMQPGDNVGLNIIGSGGTATVYIVGRVTKPGSPQARAAILSTIGDTFVVDEELAQHSTSSGTYVDLTGGPEVTATVGTTGRALVLWSAQIGWSDGTANGAMGGQVGVSVDSAAPTNDMNIRAYHQILGSTSNVGIFKVAGVGLVAGLSAGPHTFKLQYRSLTGGKTADFDNRTIAVLGM